MSNWPFNRPKISLRRHLSFEKTRKEIKVIFLARRRVNLPAAYGSNWNQLPLRRVRQLCTTKLVVFRSDRIQVHQSYPVTAFYTVSVKFECKTSILGVFIVKF